MGEYVFETIGKIDGKQLRVKFSDLEAMFEKQATTKVETNNEINEMLYSSFIGMKEVAQRILTRINKNIEIDDLDAEEYMDFVEAIKKENPKIFETTAGGEDFIKALRRGQ